MNGESKFEASASALGYAYQFRYSLFRSLERIFASGLDWTVAIEAGDDVEIVADEKRELRQLKLRKEGVILSDHATDLWKTLRIWCEGLRAGSIVPAETDLYLVTTAEVKADSAGYLLQDNEQRDPVLARTKLDLAASESKSKDNSKGIQAYNELSDEQKLELLQSVHVVPDSQDNDLILEGIKQFFRIGTREHHLEFLIQRLEGWWFQQCLACMSNKQTRIHAADLDAYTTELRDQLRPDNLPIDSGIASETSPDVDKFADRIFYHQLSIAHVSAKRIQTAVRDYLRAYAQRSQWLRHGLIFPGEIEQFERRLVDEWEIVFDQIADDISPDAAEEEKTAAAKRVYAWVEQAHPAPIRQYCTEPFVTRGSYQILSDDRRVGWHPEFVAKLMTLLEPAAQDA
ncbi:ABC-three component system protein [Lentzea cavernae]|uniref:ABC-three component systems C-terminal domain-containing protein n=1 Tax=Lentzea cavernae TaxID=2020703 RepID=A0ABQ3M981_9PSEU|nr:ABC-three component system protein [Lentzea cavernae]GHH36794.1 hypothetical protein GCM10017774_24340 [Lentzea cavernae]